jgi:hypothetical protein
MNEPNTIESDETSNNNELRLSNGSSIVLKRKEKETQIL